MNDLKFPDCPTCGVGNVPETWDARKQAQYLRGVLYLRSTPESNRIEYICMECGTTFSQQGLHPEWRKLEFAAGRVPPEDLEKAARSRLEVDEDPPAVAEALPDGVPDEPDALRETSHPDRPSLKEAMLALQDEYPALLDKAQPVAEQVRRAVDGAQHLIK